MLLNALSNLNDSVKCGDTRSGEVATQLGIRIDVSAFEKSVWKCAFLH